jgi:uncharacterized membrane protein (DUF106 family)
MMPNLGPMELFIVVICLAAFLLPLAMQYLIIRQATLSALRKFYRELQETGSKNKAKAAN